MIEQIIEWEADRLVRHVRGAIERHDLVGAGWLAYLTAPPGLSIMALRWRIRSAVRDSLRREWRASGHVLNRDWRRGGHQYQQVLWPVYWPIHFHAPGIPGHARYRKKYRVRRCLDCRMELDSPRKWCDLCNRRHRKEYNKQFVKRRVA